MGNSKAPASRWQRKLHLLSAIFYLLFRTSFRRVPARRFSRLGRRPRRFGGGIRVVTLRDGGGIVGCTGAGSHLVMLLSGFCLGLRNLQGCRFLFRDWCCWSQNILSPLLLPDRSMFFNRGVLLDRSVLFNRDVFPDRSVLFNRGVFADRRVLFNRDVFADWRVLFNRDVFADRSGLFNRDVFADRSGLFNRDVLPD